MLYCYVITDGLTMDDRIAYPDESIREGAPVTDTMPEPSEMEPNGDGESNVDGAPNGGMEDMGAADDFIDIGDGEYVEDVTGEPDAIPEASATIGGGT